VTNASKSNSSIAFYDSADWYDFLHRPETEAELPAVISIFAALGNGGRRVLEPACGTGRYLEALKARGFNAVGYDINAKTLAYARRRGCTAAEGDMATFKPKGPFDLAFCLIGSFRHLLSERAAAAHLKNTADSLAEGGLYIVGLDLCDYGSVADDEEVWEYIDGKKAAWHVMTTLPPTRRRRRERILNFITWRDGRKEGKIESSYDLFSYDWAQWEGLLKRSGLRLLAWFNQDGREQSAKRPGYFLFALSAKN
jgi:SAM-dependent methyltransferase